MSMVKGSVQWTLRMEGIVTLLVACMVYHAQNFEWGQFALLILLPDLSMLGYLKNPRLGAACYNMAHTYIAPGILIFAYASSSETILLQAALIWIAHIGIDRALGFGLKYSDDFKHTHLGKLGKN